MSVVWRLLFAGLLSVGGSSSFAAEAPEPPGAGSIGSLSTVPDTLMFSIDELNDVQTRLSTASREDGEEREDDAVENATLYVSTILYMGPDSWTVWINGKPIAAGQEIKSFEITAVDPTSVELLVPLSAQGMRPIRLSPNQTFVAKSGAVVEGPWK